MTSTRSLRGEPAAYVACRTLGHAWDSIPVTADARLPGYHANGTVFLRLRCTRCAMERFDEVSRFDGSVAYRRYVQPTGYHRDAEDRVERDQWRRAFLRIAGATKPRQKRATG